jgi:uncharacterized membrane protein YkvA (DUF1232 family)
MTFSPSEFWTKLKQSCRKAGEEVLYRALQLYYAAQQGDTPAWAKSVIYAALVYFVNPMDAVPDALPGGFTDDLGVLAAALATVAVYITPEVNRQARAKLADWFGSTA